MSVRVYVYIIHNVRGVGGSITHYKILMFDKKFKIKKYKMKKSKVGFVMYLYNSVVKWFSLFLKTLYNDG